MTWDTTVSIEGLATALAVFGAAVGFVLDLIRRWRQDVRDNSLRGTSFVIMELLEERLFHGLTEDELFSIYQAQETRSLREKYSALAPHRLSRIEFERRLRFLQFEGMIEPIGKDTWRARVQPVRSDEFRERSWQAQRVAAQDQVSQDDLAAVAERLLRESKGKWDKKDALELFAKIDPQLGISRMKTMLSAENPEDAMVAAEVLAEIRAT